METYRVILKSAPDQYIEAHGWSIDHDSGTIGFYINNEVDDGFWLTALFTISSVIGVIRQAE